MDESMMVVSEESAWEALSNTPGCGVSVCTLSGEVVYSNAIDRQMVGTDASDGQGRYSLRDISASGWGEEFCGQCQRACETGVAVRARSIHAGRQVVARIIPLGDGQIDDGRVLVVRQHVAGPLDERERVEVSRYVSLGRMSKLSPREVEVIALIGKGMPTRDIAEVLRLSPKTVEKHRDAIVRKIGEKSRIRLATLAYDAGLMLEDARRERM